MKIKNLFLFLTIILIFSGCMTYPQMIDAPLISEKNELRVDGGVSIIPSAQATISYGLTDKFALQGFGSIGADNFYYTQGAVGYFKKYSRTVMEIYTGYGYGHGEAYKDENPGTLRGNFHLPFIQFNYGWVNTQFLHADFGFSFKTGLLHTNLRDNGYIYDENYFGRPVLLKDNNLLLEPMLFMRFGGEKLKFNFKLGFSFIGQFTHPEYDIPHTPLNMGISVNYKF